jgi:hypothetical protein
MNSVPPNLFRGECHRIGFGNKVLRAEVDDCAVLAEARADQDARVMSTLKADAVLEKGDR